MKKIFGWMFLVGWVAGQLIRGPVAFPITLLDISALMLVIVNFKYHWIRRLLSRWRKFASSLSPSLTLGQALLRLSADQGGLTTATSSLANLPTSIVFYMRSGTIFLILLFSWVLSLRLFSVTEALPGLFYLLRTGLYYLLILNARILLSGVRKWIPLSMWIFIILGLLQYLVIPDTRFLLRFGWDEHYYRLIGTVLDPNYMGAMAGMIGIYAIDKAKGQRLKAKGQNKREIKYLLMVGAAFLVMVLTWSRASWISFGAAMGWWVVARKLGKLGRLGRLGRLGLLGILVVLGAVTLAAAPKPGGEGINLLRTVSVTQRLESWQLAIKIWKSHPLVGIGFNNYRAALLSVDSQVNPDSHAANSPDSSWLLILTTIGVIGVIGVMMVIREIGVIRVIGEIGEYKEIAMLIAIHSFFNNTLFFPPILGLVALMVASSPSVEPKSGSRPDRSRSPQ